MTQLERAGATIVKALLENDQVPVSGQPPQCSWCRNWFDRASGQHVPAPQITEPISHGMCGPCTQNWKGDLAKRQQQPPAAPPQFGQ